MEEKSRCRLCGKMTINNLYCNTCKKQLNHHSIKDLLNNETYLVKILTKNGCLSCPIYETEFCKITDEHILCQNSQDEMNLCLKYFKKWFSYKNK